MNINNFKYIYFLGIGGIGMSALARWFKVNHFQVAGYDKVETSLTKELSQEGIDVHYEDNIHLVPPKMIQQVPQTLVVYTPAVPQDHTELNYFRTNGFQIAKRAEVLGAITQNHFTIAVAGTHGKTTTSSIVTHILKTAQEDITAFVGGIMQNYGSNFLIGKSDAPIVVEADEYDRSFLTLHPNIAIITSTDADHLDIYGSEEAVLQSFEAFIAKIDKNGILILRKNLPIEKAARLQVKQVFTFDLADADYCIQNLRVENGLFGCDIKTPFQTITNIALPTPGKHNLLNALAAVAVAEAKGISTEIIKKALNSFKGAKRRFEYIWQSPEQCLINDYAHHPEELKALLETAQLLYPDKSVTIIFQPHLYTRTRDFAKQFSESLSLADEVYLLDIYAARELPIQGVDAQLIAKNIQAKKVKVVSKKQLIEELKAFPPQICITAGAGDIDLLLPNIQEALTVVAS